MVEDLVKTYLAELALEYQIVGTYHNHKEAMTWVATAFYIPAIIILGYKAGEIPITIWSKLFIVILLMLIFLVVLIFLFVNMQFRMRWEAADRVQAIQQLRSLLINNPEKYMEMINKYECRSHKKLTLIDIVDKRIDEEMQKRWDAIKCLFRFKKFDDRLKTEIATYIALAFATVLAIFLLYYEKAPCSAPH